jgi:dolichol-phosphate mannosyltransferase
VAALLSIVTPAFNEEKNLPNLYSRLKLTLSVDWEWIIVDDHSTDGTFAAIEALAKEDPRIRGIRLAKNAGSHVACVCALHQTKGDAAVLIAADLQDPPELIPDMVKKWKDGARVVWAARESRTGEKFFTKLSSRFFYFVLRHFVNIQEMPPQGSDFFLLDRLVIQALREFKEKNLNLIALVAWLDFPSHTLYYDKRARAEGKSGWGFEKKLKLVIDSIASLTYKPIRFMSYFGFLVALVGFGYAFYVVLNYHFGTPPPGWSSLIIVVFVIGGIQMIMMGVLGEYLWRTLDETRGRPTYLIEQRTES